MSLAFIGFIVFGTLIGAVVRMIAAGRAGSWTGSTLGGAAGALLGGSVARLDGLRGSHDSGGFSTALVCAFAVVAAYNFMAAGRRARTPALERTKE
jgi:uncharacterized membrane protein YeaQ/YmgE (transglycosylase-associated protein family)